jgi:hypothetical protein
MQTFLPYPDIHRSALVLDSKRLGKQRLEAAQIYKVIVGESTAWANHPAVLMWLGYPEALAAYHNIVLREWIRRGYENTMPFIDHTNWRVQLPYWWGNDELHGSHRSNLLRKNPAYYSQFGWAETDDLPYYWPSKNRRS